MFLQSPTTLFLLLVLHLNTEHMAGASSGYSYVAAELDATRATGDWTSDEGCSRRISTLAAARWKLSYRQRGRSADAVGAGMRTECELGR
jgi:hypothetical protein